MPPHVGEHRFEQSLRVSLTNLSLVRPAPLVAFLPLVLDKLTLLMCKPPVIAGQTSECTPPGGVFIAVRCIQDPNLTDCIESYIVTFLLTCRSCVVQ